MAVDKLVDSGQLDSDLEDVADAIRTKGGTSASLSFPNGFISAISGIQSGADFVKGSFTTPNSGTSYTLDFGKTFTKYLFLIEANDASKSTIASSGYNANKTFLFVGIRDTFAIGGETKSPSVYTLRINPSTLGFNENFNGSVTFTDSTIKIGCYDLSSSSAGLTLYKNLTYNYYIVEIK